jgi:hypothetical protein
MIRLNEIDASVLANVADFVELPGRERRDILEEEGVSPDAKIIGQRIMGLCVPHTSEHDKIATHFMKWASRNRAMVQRLRNNV